MENRVELVVDNDQYVAARDCHLHIQQKDTIRWINRTATEYTIYFEESPFEGDRLIKVPAGSNGRSGETDLLNLRSGVAAKAYHYEIRPAVVSSAMAADPIVIVHDT